MRHDKDKKQMGANNKRRNQGMSFTNLRQNARNVKKKEKPGNNNAAALRQSRVRKKAEKRTGKFTKQENRE